MIKTFRIDAVEAKRFIEPENAPKEIRIDNNSTVVSITQINNDQARLDFRFTVTYTGIGMIAIEGIILYEGNTKELMSEWRNKHRMPDHIAQEVHGTIINNCVIESVVLAKEVHLPPPIPPPAQFMNAKKETHKRDLEGYA